MLLLIDNYDSFVFNLARYFERLGQETHVVRNDAIDVAGVRAARPEAIVLSPGPCAPEQAGCSLEIVRRLHVDFPILGICLGHQAIGAALGGQVARAPWPVHGRTSPVYHNHASVFQGAPNPLTACRYHSLIVRRETLPSCLECTAWTADGIAMGLAHRTTPTVGLQFHPESILTEGGYLLLANFLRLAGITPPAELPSMASELVQPPPIASPLPRTPVTF
jgi:anthranilate synthase/aminodeoxychorismate synthase-like glutamine amidotransferase